MAGENVFGISPLPLSRHGSFVVGRDDKVRVAFQGKAKYVLPERLQARFKHKLRIAFN
jgi:hypothetical protein